MLEVAPRMARLRSSTAAGDSAGRNWPFARVDFAEVVIGVAAVPVCPVAAVERGAGRAGKSKAKWRQVEVF